MSTPFGTIHTEGTRGVKALQQSKDKLLADLKVVVDDAQALLKEAMDTSAEGITAVPAYLEDRMNAVRGNLQRVKGAIESRAKQATAVTHVYVQENPWKSIGLVAAASVIMSFLLLGACASTTANKQRD
jgi:ElaB/YqjD/DUF883 family membrane-anchored ribosome-binding protein